MPHRCGKDLMFSIQSKCFRHVSEEIHVGIHGAEPPCFKSASPHLRGRRFRASENAVLSLPAQAGICTFKAWGFSPVTIFTLPPAQYLRQWFQRRLPGRPDTLRASFPTSCLRQRPARHKSSLLTSFRPGSRRTAFACRPEPCKSSRPKASGDW